MAAASKTAAPTAKRIKVRATRMGYYDHVRRRENNVFVIDEPHFSATWMEKVTRNTSESLTTAQQALNQKFDDELESRRGPSGADADVI